MQVLDEQTKAYSNFVNSINSDQTRRLYEYSLSQFLKFGGMNPYHGNQNKPLVIILKFGP